MNTAARWLVGYAYPMHERKDAFVQRKRMMQTTPSLGKRFWEGIHRRSAPVPLGQCHMDFAGTNGGEQGGRIGRITACRFASGSKGEALTRISSICIIAGDCHLGGYRMPLTAHTHNPARWNVREKHGLFSGPPPGNPAM